MIDGCEMLIDEPMVERGRRMQEAMAAVAPGAIVTKRYVGQHRNLMIYGAGRPERQAAMHAHRIKGGRVILWDLGYWQREDAMRLSIDTLHPTAAQLAMAPSGSRFEHALREDADPNGPVLLIGLGNKSAKMYGLAPMEWERKRLMQLQRKHPGRVICWRPKGKRAVPLFGARLRHGMPIEQALHGCSLVVAKHSNVAVDACMAGVPVHCEGGAALALYGDNPQPTREQRADFLRRLSWWNWRPCEAAQAWEWVERVIACA